MHWPHAAWDISLHNFFLGIIDFICWYGPTLYQDHIANVGDLLVFHALWSIVFVFFHGVDWPFAHCMLFHCRKKTVLNDNCDLYVCYSMEGSLIWFCFFHAQYHIWYIVNKGCLLVSFSPPKYLSSWSTFSKDIIRALPNLHLGYINV